MQLRVPLSLIVLLLLGTAPATQSAGSRAVAGPLLRTGSGIQPVRTASELRVGQNQVTFGLRLTQGPFIANADVVVRVYALDDQRPQLGTEGRAFYKTFNSSEQAPPISLPTDVTSSMPGEEIEMEGMYVAQVLFDRPGPWVLEIFIAQDDGSVEVSRCTLDILAAPGSSMRSAPVSQNHPWPQ